MNLLCSRLPACGRVGVAFLIATALLGAGCKEEAGPQGAAQRANDATKPTKAPSGLSTENRQLRSRLIAARENSAGGNSGTKTLVPDRPQSVPIKVDPASRTVPAQGVAKYVVGLDQACPFKQTFKIYYESKEELEEVQEIVEVEADEATFPLTLKAKSGAKQGTSIRFFPVNMSDQGDTFGMFKVQ